MGRGEWIGLEIGPGLGLGLEQGLGVWGWAGAVTGLGVRPGLGLWPGLDCGEQGLGWQYRTGGLSWARSGNALRPGCPGAAEGWGPAARKGDGRLGEGEWAARDGAGSK